MNGFKFDGLYLNRASNNQKKTIESIFGTFIEEDKAFGAFASKDRVICPPIFVVRGVT